jgi:hypothetical protein
VGSSDMFLITDEELHREFSCVYRLCQWCWQCMLPCRACMGRLCKPNVSQGSPSSDNSIELQAVQSTATRNPMLLGALLCKGIGSGHTVSVQPRTADPEQAATPTATEPQELQAKPSGGTAAKRRANVLALAIREKSILGASSLNVENPLVPRTHMHTHSGRAGCVASATPPSAAVGNGFLPAMVVGAEQREATEAERESTGLSANIPQMSSTHLATARAHASQTDDQPAALHDFIPGSNGDRTDVETATDRAGQPVAAARFPPLAKSRIRKMALEFEAIAAQSAMEKGAQGQAAIDVELDGITEEYRTSVLGRMSDAAFAPTFVPVPAVKRSDFTSALGQARQRADREYSL